MSKQEIEILKRGFKLGKIMYKKREELYSIKSWDEVTLPFRKAAKNLDSQKKI